MRYSILLTIFFVISVSLCAGFPDISLEDLQNLLLQQNPVQNSGVLFSTGSQSPDISLDVQASSPEIRSGRDVQIYFELRNKHDYDLRNVELTVYNHPCFDDTENAGLFYKNFTLLKRNQTKAWTWKWKSDSGIKLRRDCPVMIKTNYEADYFLSQDIAVLSSEEYFQKESQGTLGSIPITSSSSDSPLDMQITFSEAQPFLEKQTTPYKYYMYINYFNKGQGLFDNSINYNPDIIITTPQNIDNFDCADYQSTGPSKYRLDVPSNEKHSLVFIRSKASPSTCSFTTKDVTIMDIKTLKLTASYKYVLDNSISIAVKP